MYKYLIVKTLGGRVEKIEEVFDNEELAQKRCNLFNTLGYDITNEDTQEWEVQQISVGTEELSPLLKEKLWTSNGTKAEVQYYKSTNTFTVWTYIDNKPYILLDDIKGNTTFKELYELIQLRAPYTKKVIFSL